MNLVDKLFRFAFCFMIFPLINFVASCNKMKTKKTNKIHKRSRVSSKHEAATAKKQRERPKKIKLSGKLKTDQQTDQIEKCIKEKTNEIK